MTTPHPIPLPSGERGKVMGFRILLIEIKHRITQLSSSPLVGEGGGEGEYTMSTPTSILPIKREDNTW